LSCKAIHQVVLLLVGFFFIRAFLFDFGVLVDSDSLSLGLCASEVAAARTAGDCALGVEVPLDGPASMLPSLLTSAALLPGGPTCAIELVDPDFRVPKEILLAKAWKFCDTVRFLFGSLSSSFPVPSVGREGGLSTCLNEMLVGVGAMEGTCFWLDVLLFESGDAIDAMGGGGDSGADVGNAIDFGSSLGATAADSSVGSTEATSAYVAGASRAIEVGES